MTTLFFDALIALVKLTDRACTAVGQIVRHRLHPLPAAGDAQPAGADFLRPGAGGHPIHSTSELLRSAALRLIYLGDDRNGLAPKLRDRAAAFAAHGD